MEFEYADDQWIFEEGVRMDLEARLYLHINDVAVTLTRTDKALRHWQHTALVQWVGVNQEYLRRCANRSELQGYYGMAPSGYVA